MKITTLESRFQNNKDIILYAIRDDKMEFTTGHLRNLQRCDNPSDFYKAFEATLYPYVSFSGGTSLGFLRGHKLQGPMKELMKIELEDDPLFCTRYGTITLNYDTHKKQVDKIAQEQLMKMREGRKEKYSKNY